jgi:hypothetical protein
MVSLRKKGSTTTTGPFAYLLRLQEIHQRHHRYLPQQDFIPGKVNLMADLTTRFWESSDSTLLSLFNISFPQTQPWTLCILYKEKKFLLTSALLRERTKLELLLNDPKHKTSIGNVGMPSAWKIESTHSCAPGPTHFQQTPSWQSGRHLPDWGWLASGNTSAGKSTFA